MLSSILGLAVLFQGMIDLVRPDSLPTGGSGGKAARERVSEEIREDARQFFFSAERYEDLKAWCDLANVHPRYIRQRAESVSKNQIDVRRELNNLAKEAARLAAEEEQEH